MRYFVSTYSQKHSFILTNRTYNAKVLLLGEFTIIDGGCALAIPFPGFSGHWKSGGHGSSLTAFFEYLRSLPFIDTNKVQYAIDEKYEFESTIPKGYGLGSSGALSAACLDAFGLEKTESTDKLKFMLSEIESFFHGKSSGLDPLTSYINKPLLVSDDSVSVCQQPLDLANFHLYDSEKNRNTRKLVNIYNQKKVDPGFKTMLSVLNKYNHALISAIINKENVSAWMKKISRLQLECFPEMIPNDLVSTWRYGLESDQYYMKLSGAGGGGFFLLFNNSRNALSFDNKLLSLKS
ncbi:MAG: hypothetical protein HKN67_10115 [Saprospiraceae bacterium]|nr:hypothetical protein [Saprospiraceae bacterium]